MRYVDYDVPATNFPQGHYWLKFNATTGKQGITAKFRIDDIQGAWII